MLDDPTWVQPQYRSEAGLATRTSALHSNPPDRDRHAHGEATFSIAHTRADCG